MRRFLPLACFLVLGSAAALAQGTSPPLDQARVLFGKGLDEARQGHWPEALVAFQAAYALAPKPAVLFNLASAQLRTGKLLVSTANYRRFLAHGDPCVSSAHRRSAAAQIAHIESRIPRLRLVIEGLRPEDRLLLDNKRIYANELDLDLWLDPGAHTLSVYRADDHQEVRRLVLAEGERRTLQFRVF